MTVAIRPSPPNGAASGFFSSIVREPLNEMDVVCPVPPEMPVALASPANTVNSLISLAEAPQDALGGRTAINFPALTVTVAEILDALEAVAGKAARERVRFVESPEVTRIVGGWPAAFQSERAARLGLRPDRNMRSIIDRFVCEQDVMRVEA